MEGETSPADPSHLDDEVKVVGLATNDDSGLFATAFRRPLLSWRLAATRTDVLQTGYEIEIAGDKEFTSILASTGRVAATSPIGAPWPGEPLSSREIVWCRVRAWTDRGVTAWSSALRIEGTLFDRDDWVAQPISPVFNVGQNEPVVVPLLRRSFAAASEVASARLYVSALGIYELWINGRRVGDELLEPGWTEYKQRLLFASHDVTGLLRAGENVLAAAVGDGWWRGNLTWMNRRAVYGETTALITQLEITYVDGTRETVATDESWKGNTGELLGADIYNGCTRDLARGEQGWRDVGFDESGWAPVVALPLPSRLEQRSIPPVRIVDTFTVVPSPGERGRYNVDCGQNLTGFLRITARADSQATLRVRHAEVLERDGTLHTAALRNAKATDTYHVPKGTFALEPAFTYHGFRYAEIELDGSVLIDRIEVCVIASDLRTIGSFACSDERVNRLYSNICWSQRGNFLAVPTDCPQRDERLGWTGDIQVFAPTACANFDSRAFLASWMVDLALEQATNGNVPSTVPNVIGGHEFEFGGVGWGDAATLVPWAIYEAYGDTEVLARQLPSMRRWVDYGASRLSSYGVWTGDFHLGDWLDPGAPPDEPEQATPPSALIASAYLAFSAGVVARVAELLGDAEAARHYSALRERVAGASWHRWHEVAGRTQTGCAMFIEFGIAPAGEIARFGNLLADLVEQTEGRIATGFLGTPLVLPALTRAGRIDAAYRLLMNERAPGWLYQVINGATTIWERWDAIQPGGDIHSGAMSSGGGSSMISFNHYAYGSVGSWLYRSLAGIVPLEPGYQMIAFAPQPGNDIVWAEASIDTQFGAAGIRWDRAGDALRLRIDLPPGACGKVFAPAGWVLPDGSAGSRFLSGRHELTLTYRGLADDLARP
ncbi:family 78 glycoside hydrolase catalytic domain [Sphingomonas tabacisoli]|uniref:alpha-L-rhamnosidase n=1 Tax=Sphingomonas tabacisoli TaxID=2249466 RepID=A0ABW4I5D5_9SPHN